MALEISEFAARSWDRFGSLDVLKRPAALVQSGIPISSAPATPAAAQSQPFTGSIVRLVPTADVRLHFYTPPTGADATIATGVDEFFQGGYEYTVAVNPGDKVAVIAGTSA